MITGSSEDSITIAVVLLCWNDQSRTRDYIAEILPILNHRVQLWVIDNCSDPPFILDSLSSTYLHLVRSDLNLGFAGGNNLGIKQAIRSNPSYILLLNTDAHLTESEFGKLFNFLQSRPDLAIVGPVLQEGNKRYYGGQDPGLHLNTRLTSRQEVDYVPGTVFLCRTDVFTDIGLLNEDYFFSVEIADFCRRAHKAGFQMAIYGDLLVNHDVGLQSPERRETLYLYYNLRNRFLYIARNYPNRKWPLYIHWIFKDIRMMAGALVEGRGSKAKAIFWALYDGLFGNFGNRNARFE